MSINIAITGSFCSGKTRVCSLLKKQGFKIIDSDSLVHKIFQRKDIQEEIRQFFGNRIFKGRRIDRKKLARLAFMDKKAWSKLNRIIHPVVIERVKKEMHSASGKNKVFEIPLLFEARMQDMFDAIVYVDAPDGIRKKRAMMRGFTEEDIIKRARYLINDKKKKQKSSFIIKNNGTIKELNKQVKQLLSHLKQKEMFNAKSK